MSKAHFSRSEWVVIRKMQVFKFLVGLHFLSAVLTPFFTEWGGLSFAQMMNLQSWFIFWVAVLAVPIGALADIWSRKGVLVLGSFISAAGFATYVMVPNFYVFALGEFLLALGLTMLKAPSKALLYDSLSDETRGNGATEIFSGLQSLHLVAILVSAPLGSIIASGLGLRYPLLFEAIPFSLAGIVALTFREPERKKEIDGAYFRTIRQGLSDLWRHKALLKLGLDFAVIFTISKMMLWLYQPLLLALGFPLRYLGVVHAIVVGFEAVVVWLLGSVWWDRLARWRKQVFLGIALLPALAFLVVGGLQGPFLFPAGEPWGIMVVCLAALVIVGFGLASQPLYDAWFNEKIASGKRRTTVLAAMVLLNNLFSAMLNPVVGRAFDGSPTLTLIGLGLMLLVYFGVSEWWLKNCFCHSGVPTCRNDRISS